MHGKREEMDANGSDSERVIRCVSEESRMMK